MSRFFSFALLEVGIVMMVCGVSASHSIGSDFSRFFTGAPTDKAIWLLGGGLVVGLIGGGGLLRATKSR